MSKIDEFYDSLILKGFEKITIEGYKKTLNKLLKENQNPTKEQAERYLIEMRNKELCGLKVKNVDFENNIIKVLGGKFKKDRIVPLSKECFRIILDYLKDY